MEWTLEHPKEDGYYWLYPEGADYAQLVDFHVNTWRDKPPAYWFLSFETTEPMHPADYPNALWSGQIHPPMMGPR